MSISPSSKESAESAAGAAAHALKPGSGWRCALCGVSSTERSCFIVPEQFSKPPHYVRCLTCEQRRLTPGAMGGIRGAVSITLFPVIMLLGLGGVHGWSPWLFLICAVLYPMAIVAHEAGHALMGAILGLELGGVGIGYGPLVWKFEVWGFPGLSEADRLSEIAVSMFPCALAYRSTRALILAGTRRSDEALQLLEYANYQAGTARDRAEREMTRAFALKISGRVNDASRAAEQAMRLHPPLISMLRSLVL